MYNSNNMVDIRAAVLSSRRSGVSGGAVHYSIKSMQSGVCVGCDSRVGRTLLLFLFLLPYCPYSVPSTLEYYYYLPGDENDFIIIITSVPVHAPRWRRNFHLKVRKQNPRKNVLPY